MKSKNKNAISLIVLVITVLVLSILAAAVILSLSNSNIIGQASKTVFKSDMTNFKQAYELYVIGKYADNTSFNRSNLNATYAKDEKLFKEIFGAIPKKYQDGLKIVSGKLVYETEDEMEIEVVKSLDMFYQTLVKQYTADGVPIPEGFKYVEGTKEDGIVIEDKENGNQFVWVPVTYEVGESESKDSNGLYPSFKAVFKTGSEIEEDSSGVYKMTGTLYNTEEPSTYGYKGEMAEYYMMCRSVQEYRGFYIARFEAGTETQRTEAVGESTVVSKQGAYVYNYVPWGASSQDTGKLEIEDGVYVTGAVELAKNMYANNEYVTSTLCYGVQWDATLNFVSSEEHDITASALWGNYTDYYEDEDAEIKLQTCGSNTDWQAKRIYDLAGNAWEWTMEANLWGSRFLRGGSYENEGQISSNGRVSAPTSYPACSRWAVNVVEAYESYGFRPALYLKVEGDTQGTEYSVTYNLSDNVYCDGASYVMSGAMYTAYVDPGTGYDVDTIEVTMDGKNITQEVYADGVITIPSVTGNIIITATGKKATYTVTYNLGEGVTSSSAVSSVEYGETYTTTFTLDTGYKLNNVKVMMGTEDVTKRYYTSSTNTIKISSVEGNIDITAEAVEDYRGYYVDVDGDNEVDGVIFADLKAGGTVSFGSYTVTIKPENKTYKEYTTNGTYNGKFGENPVLKAVGSGEDRFYVMALSDINTGTYYCWYDAAYDSGISNYSSVTSTAFGKGKANTVTMIAAWNGSEGTEEGYGDYGKQNDNSNRLDMWGVIQDKVAKGWFVPSKDEWIAFASYLTENGLTTGSSGNYTSKFGLKGYYWSSSLGSSTGTADRAWNAHFSTGYLLNYNLTDSYRCVRLAATF